MSGTIIDKSERTPIEFVHIEVRSVGDNQLIGGAVTDANGRFTLDNIPFGEYELRYSFIGYEKTEVVRFSVGRNAPNANLGTLELEETIHDLDELVISGQRSIYVNRIDHKVFNVDEDLMSVSGSASDLMQNIPSIEIDVDGNVSLRGSGNVLILINGRTSRLTTGADRAMALQQIPANAIERIEVITNPSARYRPNGTSGIINIVMKRERRYGFNGTWAANAGNAHRYNSNVLLNYNPGTINFFGSYDIRLDNRERYTFDNRVKINSDTELLSHIDRNVFRYERSLSHFARGGFNWDITSKSILEVDMTYSHWTVPHDGTTEDLFRDHNMTLTSENHRLRDAMRYDRDFSITAEFTHVSDNDHELTLELSIERENFLAESSFINR